MIAGCFRELTQTFSLGTENQSQRRTQRDIGNAGGWGWDRTDHTNIAPLVAHTLARLAASFKRKRSSDQERSRGTRRRAVVM